jgi:hypothetical protein
MAAARPIRGRLARLLAAWARWAAVLARRLEESGSPSPGREPALIRALAGERVEDVPPVPGGPPEHWLRVVRRHAPQLLRPPPGTAPETRPGGPAAWPEPPRSDPAVARPLVGPPEAARRGPAPSPTPPANGGRLRRARARAMAPPFATPGPRTPAGGGHETPGAGEASLPVRAVRPPGFDLAESAAGAAPWRPAAPPPLPGVPRRRAADAPGPAPGARPPSRVGPRDLAGVQTGARRQPAAPGPTGPRPVPPRKAGEGQGAPRREGRERGPAPAAGTSAGAPVRPAPPTPERATPRSRAGSALRDAARRDRPAAEGVVPPGEGQAATGRGARREIAPAGAVPGGARRAGTATGARGPAPRPLPTGARAVEASAAPRRSPVVQRGEQVREAARSDRWPALPGGPRAAHGAADAGRWPSLPAAPEVPALAAPRRQERLRERLRRLDAEQGGEPWSG